MTPPSPSQRSDDYTFRHDTQSQLHVLEAIIASTLILGVIIFALQATAVTPLTVSTSDQHIETQQQKIADGVLTTAKDVDINRYKRISPPYDYTNTIIAANPSPNASTQHLITVNITGNAVGNSLNIVTIDYSGDADMRPFAEKPLSNLYVAAIDKSGSGTPSVTVVDDFKPNETITDNNGTKLTVEFTGNYDLEQDDVLVFSYTGAVNPSSKGDYSVSVNVNGDIYRTGTLSVSPPDSAATVTALEELLLYWNPNTQTFHNATTRRGYLGTTPNITMGVILQDVFNRKQIAVNLDVTYQRQDGRTGKEAIVHQGQPSDNAVTATTTVVLTDNQRLTSPVTNKRVSQEPTYPIPDVSPNTEIYNVLQVKLTVWRI